MHMPEIGWAYRFRASTRGRIIALLRRSRHTVDELARALGLTDNAVRTHLAALERDGLVAQGGLRPSARKPAFEFELTPEAEELLSRAYAPALGALLAALDAQLGPAVAGDLLRRAGKQLAGAPPPAGNAETRLAAAVDVLNGLGGLAEAEISRETLRIRGYGCPLATVVAGHPEACELAAALVSEIVGQPMRSCCEHGARPRCRFEGERRSG
jgi:predicted ArsR family transcriptional regulator